MKTIILIFLLVILVSKNTYSCNKISISAHPNYPPFHWYDGYVLKGASIESFKEMFKNSKVKVNAVYVGPWKRVLSQAEQGKVDAVVALKNSTSRKKYLTFTTEHFYSNPFSVFRTKDSVWTYREWKDLKGKRGLFNVGDSFGNKFDNYLKSELNTTRTRDISQAFRLLKRERYDYYVTGYHTGISHIDSNEDFGDVTAVTPYINDDFIFHGFSLKSKCLKHLPFINKKLKEMRESGKTKEIIDKYQRIWREEYQKGKVKNH